jgi:DnaJ-class molecular chaperone
VQNDLPDHYATLGLDRNCTESQIRTAYRLLVKQLHPDVNHGSAEAVSRTQELIAAYETLSDSERRLAYDREIKAREKSAQRTGKRLPNLTKEVQLRIEEFFRGAELNIQINEPGHAANETLSLTVPPDTAPGARFKIARPDGGFLIVRVKVRPDFRFKARGSDLRCDLKINSQRAQRGGTESLRTARGNFLTVRIPANVARGEIIRIAGEGLPKSRGGHGDLLVRIIYTPEIRIQRKPRRFA